MTLRVQVPKYRVCRGFYIIGTVIMDILYLGTWTLRVS